MIVSVTYLECQLMPIRKAEFVSVHSHMPCVSVDRVEFRLQAFLNETEYSASRSSRVTSG
jgi:hypothetical protein